MIKDSSATPWEYRRFSELMASVKEDLHMFDDANLIKDNRYIKVIMKCNEKLGERIHQSRTCKLVVKDYAAPSPEDLWKIENIYGISNKGVTREYLTGIFGATQMVFHEEDKVPIPTGNERIIPIGECSIVDGCGGVGISRIDRDYIQKVENKIAFSLTLSPNVENQCVEYSPCGKWAGGFWVDLANQEFKFGFREGEVILTYLGSVTDSEGELMYPFHPLLNDFYEYAVKEKVLEDILMNSEADVITKLQLASKKKDEAYVDAFTFIQSAKANQYSKIRKKYEREFYNKWYKAFS